MRELSTVKIFALLVSVLFCSVAISKQIPSPAEQSVDVITNTNVSTLKSIDVFFADQQIPKNYAGEKITNVTGFSWYASKHFALQTDVSDDEAKKALQVLEMAYPHWVNYINNEPASMHNTRIPIVYASDWQRIKETTQEYGFLKSPVINGEMMYYNSTAYAHKAAPLYLLLHEGFHAFADVFKHGLKTGWFTEGAAQDSAHYVINDDWTQIAVFVFDRGHYNKWRYSMEKWRKSPPPVKEFTKWGPPYNAGATIQHFMKDDPLRNQYWKIWAKQLDTDFFSKNSHQSLADSYSDKLLYSFFGSQEKFKETWEQWLKTTELTTLSKGRWAREGNKVFLDKVTDKHPDNGHISYQLPMGEKATNNPLALDYFPAKPSPLIDNVNRGVKEPSIGVLLENITTGKSGLGFFPNTDNDSMIKVMILDNSQLVFDGTAINEEIKQILLPAKMITELKEGTSGSLGLTVTLKHNAITAQLKTNKNQFLSTYQLPSETIDSLLKNKIALVAEDNSKTRMTPYFDDGRPSYDSYLTPAPMNKWRNTGDAVFGQIVEANWLLGTDAPQSLQDMQNTLHEAATLSHHKQVEALFTYNKKITSLVEDVTKVASNKAPQALLALSGLQLKSSWQESTSKDKVAITAIIKNPNSTPINGQLHFNIAQPLAVLGIKQLTENVSIKANDEITITKTFDRNPNYHDAFKIFINAQVKWNNQLINLNDTIRSTPWPGLTMSVDKSITIEEHNEANNTALVNSKVYADDDFAIYGKLTYEVTPKSAVKNPLIVEIIKIAAMDSKKLPIRFLLNNKTTTFNVKVTGEFYIDSEPYRFVKEVNYNK